MRFSVVTPALYILRHGQTEWNALGRLQGHHDSPLTEQGRADARRQGAILRGVFAVRGALPVYTSPQGRVRQTAALALEGLGAQVFEDARLKEASAGHWQGLTEAEIEAKFPQAFAAHPTRLSLGMGAPGGESFENMAARCGDFLAELSEPSVIITHGVTLAVLRGLVLGLGYEAILQLDHRQGVVYALRGGSEQVLLG